MGSLPNFRSEQRLSVRALQREIRAADPTVHSKYIREFERAFRRYQSGLEQDSARGMMASANLILLGDYHSLPASQRSATTLVEQLALSGERKVVLAVEAVYSSDQEKLDRWWRRNTNEAKLRAEIDFDSEWGYDWPEFYELLVTGREHAEAIYGLDSHPRGDLRRISSRDRHVASQLLKIRKQHPDATIVALVGESHLAPSHLPRVIKRVMPAESTLTVLQNIDSLYWQTLRETKPIKAVRVADNVICVFNSTPLKKYESYRQYLAGGDAELPARDKPCSAIGI